MPQRCRVTLTQTHEAPGTNVAPGQQCPLPQPPTPPVAGPSTTVLPCSGCLQHTTEGRKKIPGAPFNCSPLWFEGDEHQHASPGSFLRCVDSEHASDMSCRRVNKPKRTLSQSFGAGEDRKGEGNE